MKTNEGFWFTAEYNGGKLAVKSAVGRAWGKATLAHNWDGAACYCDHQSMIALKKTRLLQLEELRSTLTHQVGLGMWR